MSPHTYMLPEQVGGFAAPLSRKLSDADSSELSEVGRGEVDAQHRLHLRICAMRTGD